MTESVKTKFTASMFDRPAMRRQSNQIALDLGFKDKNDIDSFRHGYVTGKIEDQLQDNIGERLGAGIARTMGILNEVGGLTTNSTADRESDLENNNVGIQIAEETRRDVQQLQAKYELSDEEADDRFETMFRDRIAQAVKEGRLKQLGDDETAY